MIPFGSCNGSTPGGYAVAGKKIYDKSVVVAQGRYNSTAQSTTSGILSTAFAPVSWGKIAGSDSYVVLEGDVDNYGTANQKNVMNGGPASELEYSCELGMKSVVIPFIGVSLLPIFPSIALQLT